MAAHTPNTKASKISSDSNEIPISGHVTHSTSELDVHTTCNNKAIDDDVNSLPENNDRELRLHHVRTRREKEKIKELVELESNREDQPSGLLRIQNAIPASQLPSPRRATTEEKEILKKNFWEEIATMQPRLITDASLEDQKLP